MNDYLAKPVQLQQLSDVLQRSLRLEAPSRADNSAVETLPVFDESDLLGRMLDDRALAMEIVRGFMEDCPRQLALLSERLQEVDADGTRQAHKIKGAAGSVAARRLRAAASETEQAALAGDLQKVCTLLPCLDEEFGRLKTTLQESGWVDLR